MVYSKELINQVREANDLIEIAEEYFTLHQKGEVYKALCTHEGEKNESLTFYPDTQTFHCFGCKAGGKKTGGSDVYAFIGWVKNISWDESFKLLAKRANIDISINSMTPRDLALSSLYESAKNEATRHMHYLAKDVASMYFFAQRGITQTEIEKWQLGSNNNFPNYTIFDHQGRPVSYSRREGTSDKKYSNGSTTAIFKKSSLLYGYYQCKQLIKQHDFVVVVEGYNDVILLEKYGVPAVGMMGLVLKEEQVEAILKLTKNIVLFFDGDERGIEYCRTKIEFLQSYGFEHIYVINIANKDPDDIALQYKEQTFDFIINNRVDFYLYLANEELLKLRKTIFNAKKDTMLNLKNIFAMIKDEDMRLIYKDEIMRSLINE